MASKATTLFFYSLGLEFYFWYNFISSLKFYFIQYYVVLNATVLKVLFLYHFPSKPERMKSERI